MTYYPLIRFITIPTTSQENMTSIHESLYAEFRKLEGQAEELEAALITKDAQFRINAEQACNQLRARQAELIESASRDPFTHYEEFIQKCLQTTLN